MNLLLVSLVGLLASGALALLAGRWPRASNWIGAGGAWVFALTGLDAAIRALASGRTETFRAPWPVPGGELALELDPLSAWFLLPIFLLAPLVAAAALGWVERRRVPAGGHWFLFQLLVAAMALVVVARNGVLFLVAWETMALAAFGLLVLAREDDGGGGLAWLVASHFGAAFLVALFLLADRASGGSWLEGAAPLPREHALRFLLLALAGFGTKAALVPFHSWAPDAYGAAPGHLAALLSGAMSKLGLYGLLRLLFSFADWKDFPPAASFALLALGLGSAAFGSLLAVAQRDLRRVLAATSIESAGLAVTAIAVALLGRSVEANLLVVLGLGAALLHVVNDAAFKGLLFLGAGALRDAAGTDRLERLGGWLKLLPRTGLFLLVGGATLLALPPFAAFPSELLLITGALEGATTLAPRAAAPLFLVLGTIAVVAGLSLAATARALGGSLLGRSRDPALADAAPPREPARSTLIPLGILAALCLLLGLGAPIVLQLARPVVAQALGDPAQWEWCWRQRALPIVVNGVIGASVFGALLYLVAQVRRLLLVGRRVTESTTWACGDARPLPRAQYTPSSLAAPLVTFFGPLLRFRRRVERPEGARGGSLSTETEDLGRARLEQPLFRLLAAITLRLRILQHGYVHLYVLAIAATLLVLLLLEVT